MIIHVLNPSRSTGLILSKMQLIYVWISPNVDLYEQFCCIVQHISNVLYLYHIQDSLRILVVALFSVTDLIVAVICGYNWFHLYCPLFICTFNKLCCYQNILFVDDTLVDCYGCHILIYYYNMEKIFWTHHY